MKERPMLFNAPMVRALPDGSKTQTRRVMKVQPPSAEYKLATIVSSTARGEEGMSHWIALGEDGFSVNDGKQPLFRCPYGQPGDRLWVRETWAIASKATDLVKVYYAASERQSHTEFHEYFPVEKAAGMPVTWPKYRPSIHMPRWASRTTLEITGVRVERLQDISEADAIAEGMRPERGQLGDEDVMVGIITNRLKVPAPVARYALLWDEINGNMPNNWNSNPWVWVVEFKPVAAGIAKKAA